jgi:hypothetical protein
VHGDEQLVSEEVSGIKYKENDSILEANWFFEAKHEHAKDSLVMQLGFKGKSVKGQVWIYSPSSLHWQSDIECVVGAEGPGKKTEKKGKKEDLMLKNQQQKIIAKEKKRRKYEEIDRQNKLVEEKARKKAQEKITKKKKKVVVVKETTEAETTVKATHAPREEDYEDEEEEEEEEEEGEAKKGEKNAGLLKNVESYVWFIAVVVVVVIGIAYVVTKQVFKVKKRE